MLNTDGFSRNQKMAKRILLLAVLIGVMCSLLGCQTAHGIKEDVQFIGDKTVEILDNS